MELSEKEIAKQFQGPRVLNKQYDCVPADAVYVGRPSKWGNPFSHKSSVFNVYPAQSRAAAIAKHREWLLSQPILVEEVKKELRGKDLVCWCSPLPCHADTLLEIANS